jgi:hypothetical protein
MHAYIQGSLETTLSLTLPGHAKMPMAQKVSEIEKKITNLQLWMRFQVDAICLHQKEAY